MKPCRAWLVVGLVALSGCTTPALRMQSPEDTSAARPQTRLVGDVTRPFGQGHVKLEAIALVTGLNGTGEDPPPTPQRAALLHDLQTIGVHNPNQLLASPNTAMVFLRGYLPPGVRKGDHFDLEVTTPDRTETTSLRGGWIMQTRLTEMAVLGGQLHEGHTWGLGEGPVLVDPSADGEKDRAELLRGLVLGGGVALKSRDMGLFIGPDDKSVRLSGQIGTAINRRFHTYVHGIKEGVATPRTDERIDLKIHPRYKDNISRYIRVLASIPLNESPSAQSMRIKLLESQLHDPLIAANSALQLEAIGKEAIPALIKGSESSDPEVRFYAAEALAYLDAPEGAVPLAQTAREEPAFRAYALAALSTMEDSAAHEELLGLLETPSAETRYGAFRAIWAMDPNDAAIRGENLKGQFSYHVLGSSIAPMVHVTRSLRPEVVLFGENQRLEPPFVLEAGKSILVKGAGDRVTVSRFSVGQPDQKRIVGMQLDEIIRTIVELGGTYPDVVQALQQAKISHALTSRFEVDAVPDGNRKYHQREAADAKNELTLDDHRYEVGSPLPELFSKRRKSTK